jgi:GT2 family glycosyltransferase
MLGYPFPLYVIVINWNLPYDTIECIQSILAGATPDVHIILVDNGSSDNSITLFRKTFGMDVLIIENPINLGFAAAVNIGIREALNRGAQSVLLLNNDTTIDPTMITHLASTAKKHPRAGLVGPFIYYFDHRDRIWRVGDRDYPWLPFPWRLSDRFLATSKDTDFRLDYITACGMLINSEVLHTVGHFDERYFMYYEDADFCQRVKQTGYEIWCSPKSRMWHKVSLSARKQKPVTRYLQSWGRTEFYHTYKRGYSWMLLVVYLIGRAIAITLLDVFSGNWSLIRPLWVGIADAFGQRPARPAYFVEN